jgi:hypothetical protein|nr:hypothetical protein [Petralouisia muris]
MKEHYAENVKKRKKELAFFLNVRGAEATTNSARNASMGARVSGLSDEIMTRGTEDSDGILFIRFHIMEIAAALSRSPQTCKRSLNETAAGGA